MLLVQTFEHGKQSENMVTFMQLKVKANKNRKLFPRSNLFQAKTLNPANTDM